MLRGLAWADRATSGRPLNGAAARHGFTIQTAPPIGAGERGRLEVYATAASGARALLPSAGAGFV